jgi:DNA polymerase-3 subunit delta
MNQALQRLDQNAIHQAILHCAKADRIIKGIAPGDEWDALLATCISLMKPQAPLTTTRH